MTFTIFEGSAGEQPAGAKQRNKKHNTEQEKEKRAVIASDLIA